MGVIHVPEARRIFGRLTVEENLRAGAAGRRRAAERDRVLDLFPRLGERLKQPAGLLSGGEQQMLALGRAIMARPKLLLLDEPSLGLAPNLVQQVAAFITAVRAEHTAVMLVEQNVGMALSVADRGVVLQVGRAVLTESADALRSDDRIRDLYLGGSVAQADDGRTSAPGMVR
jgi:branched-chain amino acid transport system ATP-binding protein